MSRYHHGDLPNALRCSAADVIVEKGLGGFSLREVARRAGVSHNAPAHHFGDVRGLLTSLAVEGFEHMDQAFQEVCAGIDDPVDRLVALGQAYVRTGATYPAHCEVMFRHDLIDEDDPALQHAGLTAYATLESAVAQLSEADGLDLDISDASKLLWSAMQGLLLLHPSMVVIDALVARPEPSRERLVETFTRTIIDGLRSR